MAGFEVITYGRFWVIAEDRVKDFHASASSGSRNGRNSLCSSRDRALPDSMPEDRERADVETTETPGML